MITIAQITVETIPALQILGMQTFIETFSEHNSKEDMELYLASSFNIEKLTSELENANSKFYFAADGQNKIGYLKVNLDTAQSDIKDADSLEIERIYVMKSYFGKKVGQLLYEKAFSIAKELRLKYIWLGVWEKNERALQFYKKNGFVEFDQHQFVLGEDVQNDILMKLVL